MTTIGLRSTMNSVTPQKQVAFQGLFRSIKNLAKKQDDAPVKAAQTAKTAPEDVFVKTQKAIPPDKPKTNPTDFFNNPNNWKDVPVVEY